MKYIKQMPEIDFVASGIGEANIPRNQFLRAIEARFSGSYTIASSSGTVVEDNPLAILSMVEVIAGGSKKIHAMSGIDTYFFNKHRNYVAATLLAGLGTVTDHPVSAHLEIPFESFGTVQPLISCLNPVGLSSLVLRCSFGPLTYLVTGSGGITETTGSEFKIQSAAIESRAAVPSFIQINNVKEKTVSETTRLLVVPLDTAPGRILRSLYVRSVAGSPVIRSNAVVNYMSVEDNAGNKVIDTVNFTQLREHGAKKSGLSLDTGIFYIDMIEDGNPLSGVPLTKEANLVFDVTTGTATKLFIVPSYLDPITG